MLEHFPPHHQEVRDPTAMETQAIGTDEKFIEEIPSPMKKSHLVLDEKTDAIRQQKKNKNGHVDLREVRRDLEDT